MITWLRTWFGKLLRAIRHKWTGHVLNAELSRPSAVRTAAELAVERVVLATKIAPDCVSATVIDGGSAILIKHDRGQEGFIGRSYDHAADKAIEWLTKREGRFILQAKTTGMSRKNQKIFDAQRRDLVRRRRENQKVNPNVKRKYRNKPPR